MDVNRQHQRRAIQGRRVTLPIRAAITLTLIFATKPGLLADISSGSSVPVVPLISGVQTADMDTSVRPQDDLYQYANGTWLLRVPIPDDRSYYGVDAIMSERSLVQQREL